MTKRMFMRLVVVVLLAVALFVVTPFVSKGTHTVHASSCTGACLYNQDPIDAGCSGSPPDGSHAGSRGGCLIFHETGIFDQFGTKIARFRNIYSTACNVNWTWGQLTGGSRLKISIATSGETTLCEPTNCTSFLTFASNAWTNMVNGTNLATSCAVSTSPEDHHDYNVCYSM
ncbi:MAG TPA: hypothetical protein VGF67_09480 [Ktedonobacteraceae bacterium]|jgi:hypothetical protein